ncbi:hypothetical protein WME94_06980 [Sorangium sp. So ce429]
MGEIMRRFLLASLVPVSAVASMSSVGSAWGAIKEFTIESKLDDRCNIYVDGKFTVAVEPNATTEPIVVGEELIPGRTNILLRCSDGGVYCTSVEGIWSTCAFSVDEEGAGLTGSCTP